jgi:hypothetical protein
MEDSRTFQTRILTQPRIEERKKQKVTKIFLITLVMNWRTAGKPR